MKPYPPELEPFIDWHPFSVFPSLLEEGSLNVSIYALTVPCLFIFLWRSFRQRRFSEPMVSWTLILTAVPFVIFSWRCYSLAQFVPLAIELNNHLSHIDIRELSYQSAYSFQFGVIISSILLSLHFLAHLFCRNTRNAEPITPPNVVGR